MPSLKIPDSGLLLESPDYNSGDSSPQLPLQAFAISLSENVIEDMIKCVQNGKGIELSLGSTPTFFYGSNEHVLSPDSESFTYDLVLSKPNDPQRKHYRLPNPTMSFWNHPSRGTAVRQIGGPKQNMKFSKTQASKPSGDSDIDALRSSFAQAEGDKRQAVIIDKPLPSKKTAKSKSGLMSMASIGGGSVSRSLPSSPAQNPVASSQLAMERAKEHRYMIIHELASAERPYNYLRNKWEGDDKDFKTALEKAADFNNDTQRWFLKKIFWKELNVWEYPYDSDTDRELAISHAIGKYDRVFRLGPGDPLWQMLLPKEERGKGKCLSRLQPTLARGAAIAAPKIKVQKADDANGDGNDSDASKSKGGESITRSISQPLPTKSKKTNDVKKILPPAKKSAAAKASPMGRNGAKPATNGKFKSAEFVEDSSDDDDDGLPLSKSKPETRPEARQPKETKETTAAPKLKPKPKPVVKEVLKPQPGKRVREDDDSSSSSGTPLSKRIKQKEHIRPPVALKHRPSDASQNSRNSSGSASFKASKNTSPAKSSPLASSPPTNAADLDEADNASTPQTEPETVPKPRTEVVVEKSGMKRKAGAVADEAGKSKKARTMEEISKKAAKFHKYWETYAALHHELEALEETQRPAGKVADLYDMRGRLEVLKFEITRDSVEVG